MIIFRRLLDASLLSGFYFLATPPANGAALTAPKDNARLKLATSPPATHLHTLPSSSNTYWPLDSPSPLPGPRTSNASTLSANLPTCNGRLYGRNFNLASCRQILHAMSVYDKPKTFGERSTGTYDAPLPFRYLSHDGLCAIDIAHTAGVLFDTITPLAVKEAAKLLIDICVAVPPSQGGLLTGLGVNGNLALRVVRYQPSVFCGPEESGPPWITCRHIIDAMPANNKRQYFAPK